MTTHPAIGDATDFGGADFGGVNVARGAEYNGRQKSDCSEGNRDSDRDLRIRVRNFWR